MTTLPHHARVVVIGGGVIGTSSAYHLAAQGRTDIVVPQRDKLTSGTTWHATGQIATAGMATGFRPCGHMHLASTATRPEVQRCEVNVALAMGHHQQEVSPAVMKAMVPLLDIQGPHSAIWTPNDGTPTLWM